MRFLASMRDINPGALRDRGARVPQDVDVLWAPLNQFRSGPEDNQGEDSCRSLLLRIC